MGNISRTLEPRLASVVSWHNLLPTDARNIASGVDHPSLPADDEDDPLNAARGIFVGVSLGSVIWTITIWLSL